MRLSVSRRWLRWGGLIGLAAAALVGLYALGDRLTPRDAGGRPLIYSPSVQAAESYRRQVEDWIGEMAQLDQRLTALLSTGEITGAAQLYALSDEAETLATRATGLAEDVAFTPAPPALVGLAALAEEAAAAHLEAAVAVSQWVGAPEVDQLERTLEALRAARSRRHALEESQWVRD